MTPGPHRAMPRRQVRLRRQRRFDRSLLSPVLATKRWLRLPAATADMRSIETIPKRQRGWNSARRTQLQRRCNASHSQGRLDHAGFHHRGEQLKPKAGDCCVFCSYGSVPHRPRNYRGRPIAKWRGSLAAAGAFVTAPKGDQAIGALAWTAASRHQIRTGPVTSR